MITRRSPTRHGPKPMRRPDSIPPSRHEIRPSERHYATVPHKPVHAPEQQNNVFREQRVGVFIDVSNLYHSAKHQYNAKVNYNELLKVLVGNRTLVRAIAYAIESEVKGEDIFHKALSAAGFEVKLKPLQIFPGGAKKGDWDIGIAMDMIELAPKLDVAILVSGDGDYVDLIHHLKRAMGVKVEVSAFGRSTSGKLIDVADSFYDMDKNPNLLIR